MRLTNCRHFLKKKGATNKQKIPLTSFRSLTFTDFYRNPNFCLESKRIRLFKIADVRSVNSHIFGLAENALGILRIFFISIENVIVKVKNAPDWVVPKLAIVANCHEGDLPNNLLTTTTLKYFSQFEYRPDQAIAVFSRFSDFFWRKNDLARCGLLGVLIFWFKYNFVASEEADVQLKDDWGVKRYSHFAVGVLRHHDEDAFEFGTTQIGPSRVAISTITFSTKNNQINIIAPFGAKITRSRDGVQC